MNACRKIRYRERNPTHTKIIQGVRDAVKRGKLIKPDACEECTTKKIARELIGHHDDYAKPLDVRWLCQMCHRTWHKLNGKGKNYPT